MRSGTAISCFSSSFFCVSERSVEVNLNNYPVLTWHHHYAVTFGAKFRCSYHMTDMH